MSPGTSFGYGMAQNRKTPPTTLQHRLDVGERLAHCNLDSMSATDIERNIHVAAFLSTVNAKQAKMLWERKATKKGLDEYIRPTAEAEKEMERVQNKHDKEKEKYDKTEGTPIKEEPVGKINAAEAKHQRKELTETERKNPTVSDAVK